MKKRSLGSAAMSARTAFQLADDMLDRSAQEAELGVTSPPRSALCSAKTALAVRSSLG
jgi:geranylgeranyl pyrophosphate synthase